MPECFRSGEAVLTSGVYDVVDEGGTVLIQLPLATGDRFPPYRGKARSFSFNREIIVKYTTVASAAVMDETTADFAWALESLAKK